MFDIILFPFNFIIEKLFEFSLYISFNNIGLAIILLSLLVYILTFPLSKRLNKRIQKEDDKKEKIKHLTDEIDGAYKGQTRYFYTKTLYSIHGISPASDIFPLLKLFIQIPFFLAAYYYLLNLQLLVGTPFYFLNDLSQQDQLLPFGGIHLNILPLLMFGINIISSYIFAKENKNEKIALMFTGVLFLVLLYKMPAALVLYWTCNNLISLILEIYKSRFWIKKKLKNLKTLRLNINRMQLTVLLFSLLTISLVKTVSIYSYMPNGLPVDYILTITILLILLIWTINTQSTRKVNSTKNDISIKNSIFLYLGSLTPLFVMGKKNHEFIKDGLILNFYGNLIIPSLILYTLLVIYLRKKKSSFFLISTISTFIVFFSLPMINYSLKITAETSFYYSLLFIIFAHVFIIKIDKKLIPIFSIVSLLAFLSSSYDFIKTNNGRNKEEDRYLSKILNNKKTLKMYNTIKSKLKETTTIPPVYLLVYDGLTGKEVMNYYNLKYDLNFLEDEDFTVYNDILSYKETSVPTMSGILELSNKSIEIKDWAKKFHMLGYNLVDNIFELKNMNRTYMASKFFFKGLLAKPGSEIISIGEKSINSLLEGVIIGEFKFDLELKKNFKSNNWKEVRNTLIKKNKGFFYSHHPYPGHSQNSGKCLNNEVELYSHRRALAIKSIKEDIKNIKSYNPNTIIIIAGDHGGHLSADCLAMKSYNYKNVTLPTFAETKGTFLAIKWPTEDFKKYDNIKNLQSVFHSIFAYILQDEEILNYKPTQNICLGKFCTTYDGKVLQGQEKGLNIFKVLKKYKLNQF